MEVGGQRHTLADLSPENIPGTHCVGELGGLQDRSGRVQKISSRHFNSSNSQIFCMCDLRTEFLDMYRGADKSLARPTSRCTLFDGENISFDASLVIYTSIYIYIHIYIHIHIYE